MSRSKSPVRITKGLFATTLLFFAAGCDGSRELITKSESVAQKETAREDTNASNPATSLKEPHALNLVQPKTADVAQATNGEERDADYDFEILVRQSQEDLILKTNAQDRVWQMAEADWHVDQDRGELVFSLHGARIAACPVQIIGTFNKIDSTWLWAWGNESVEPAQRQDAERVKRFGAIQNIPELLAPKLNTDEEKCWEFAAIACYLQDAYGAYRGPDGDKLVLMTFGRPALEGAMAEKKIPLTPRTPLLAPAEFKADVPADVRDCVLDYVRCYHEWSKKWAPVYLKLAEQEQDDESVRNEINADYIEFTQRLCVPELTPQPYSLSDDPLHDPTRELIRDAAVKDSLCWVRTTRSSSHLGSSHTSDFEYHIRRIDNRWLLEHVYVVIDGIKYECL